jgi:hypothetical protein
LLFLSLYSFFLFLKAMPLAKARDAHCDLRPRRKTHAQLYGKSRQHKMIALLNASRYNSFASRK